MVRIQRAAATALPRRGPARPLQPLTDQRLGVRLIKDPKARCTNPDCSLFKKLIDDAWPPRYAA